MIVQVIRCPSPRKAGRRRGPVASAMGRVRCSSAAAADPPGVPTSLARFARTLSPRKRAARVSIGCIRAKRISLIARPEDRDQVQILALVGMAACDILVQFDAET